MQAPPIDGTIVDMIIAIDTGGTKTLIARFSDDGEPVSSQKFLTPRDQAEYLSQVISVTRELSVTKKPKFAKISAGRTLMLYLSSKLPGQMYQCGLKTTLTWAESVQLT